jgi:hypothetical protein
MMSMSMTASSFFLRFLGFVFLVAFYVSLQAAPLLGETGISPAEPYVAKVRELPTATLFTFPSLFLYVKVTDQSLRWLAYAGMALAGLAVAGFGHALVFAAMWALYSSLVSIAGDSPFYGYGWESQLLETGFLAVFAAPFSSFRVPRGYVCPGPIRWAIKLLLAKIMLGAGLIKIRGDRCWHDLTCMDYFYETQPVPNPVSYFMHTLQPRWFSKLQVAVNHFVELVIPFYALIPVRSVQVFVGAANILFQVILTTTGNLSFLNWLTIAPAIMFFEGGHQKPSKLKPSASSSSSMLRTAVSVAVVAVLASMNAPVLHNMLLADRQLMNASFDPLRIANTYGAFGHIGKVRHEVVIEVSWSSQDDGGWEEVPFPCKPQKVDQPPCVLSPFHHRLTWQIWFSSQSAYTTERWLFRLFRAILHGNPAAKELLPDLPTRDTPPLKLRARLFKYKFGKKDWWERELVGDYVKDVPIITRQIIDSATGI